MLDMQAEHGRETCSVLAGYQADLLREMWRGQFKELFKGNEKTQR